jgi:hypothetical protein
MPQVCFAAAAEASTSPPVSMATHVSPPTTGTGTPLGAVEPSPSWPWSLEPQHHAKPSRVMPLRGQVRRR